MVLSLDSSFRPPNDLERIFPRLLVPARRQSYARVFLVLSSR